MNFIGIVTLEGALAVRDGKKTFSEAIIRDVLQVNDLDAPVADIVPLQLMLPFRWPWLMKKKYSVVLSPRLLSCLPLLPENQQMLKIKEELPKQLFFYLVIRLFWRDDRRQAYSRNFCAGPNN